MIEKARRSFFRGIGMLIMCSSIIFSYIFISAVAAIIMTFLLGKVIYETDARDVEE